MRVLMTRLTKFERHSSTSEMQAALVFKLFASKFLNTSLMVMVINANFNGFNNPLTYELVSTFGINGLFASSARNIE